MLLQDVTRCDADRQTIPLSASHAAQMLLSRKQEASVDGDDGRGGRKRRRDGDGNGSRHNDGSGSRYKSKKHEQAGESKS